MNILFNRSMVQKICIISLVCLTIPNLFFSFFLYKNQSTEFYTQLVREQSIAIEQATGSIDATLHSISELSQDLAYSDPLNGYLSRQHRADLSKFPIWSQKQLAEVIASIKYSLKYRNLGINAANIFVTDSLAQEGNYFWSASRLSSLDFFQEFKDSSSYAALYFLDAKETDSFRNICGYSFTSADKNIILIIQKINTEYSGPCMGYILFECSPQKIFPSLFTPSQRGYFAWFHDSQKGYGTKPDQDMENILKQSGNSSPFLIEMRKQKYLCCTMEHFNITIVDTHPLSTDTYKIPALRLSLVLVGFALVQFVVLTIFIRGSFNHLHKDLNLMDAIIAHGFTERIPETHKDEIGMIAHRYNILLDKIGSLIQETVQKETAQTQAQLKALQYQINPHFIYNTLSIFSGYASQNGQDTLAESIDSFGQLLRYNIKNDSLYATIESELRSAASLINIYNIRYFNRMKLTLDVPPSITQVQIIKFLLQPLLENSILHGLIPPITSLHILIAIRKPDNFVEIQISDDGDGMSPERLQEVRCYMNNPSGNLPASSSGSFIGLQNICKRLKLFYGKQAQLTIESQLHCGTTILIRIPADTLREHDKRSGMKNV